MISFAKIFFFSQLYSRAEDFDFVALLTKSALSQIEDVVTTSMDELNEIYLDIQNFVTKRIVSTTIFFDAITKSSLDQIDRSTADSETFGCDIDEQKESIQNIANETLDRIENYSRNKILEAGEAIAIFARHANDSGEFTAGLEEEISKCVDGNATCLLNVVTTGATSVTNLLDELKNNVFNATKKMDVLKDDVIKFSAKSTAESVGEIASTTRELLRCLKIEDK